MEDKTNGDRYARHFDQARRSIIRIDRKAYGEKKRVILCLAENLTIEGMPDHMVCSESVKRLQDIVSPTFVRRCLPSRYKDRKQSSNAKKQARNTKKKQLMNNDPDLATHVSPHVHSEQPKPIVIDNYGTPIQGDDLSYTPTTQPAKTAVDVAATEASGGMLLKEEGERHSSGMARFVVPKSRLLEMIEAVKAAKKICYLYFDENRELAKIEPDAKRPDLQVQRPHQRDAKKSVRVMTMFDLLSKSKGRP